MNLLYVGNIIVLENDIEFIILDVIDNENFRYLLLSEVADDEHIVIRKYDNDLDLIVSLDDEEEVKLMLRKFLEKSGE